MPSGLYYAQGTFQRLMRDQNLQSLLIYLDDLIIFPLILLHIWQVWVQLKPGKCHILKKEVQYLSAEGISPEPDKLKCVQDMFRIGQLQSQ